ncbi:hypothetical protein CCY01nite_39600 [Chitinophaga cymbidii]|uniref:Uncharacterized protein n=1 Tax=Chitinophaga cymbidii TaxID=1096750 RepID=A0A512RPS7_9BACT|nr:hypothetical protein CCY01nite_39600 [Chitinophaga cymbidii]
MFSIFLAEFLHARVKSDAGRDDDTCAEVDPYSNHVEDGKEKEQDYHTDSEVDDVLRLDAFYFYATVNPLVNLIDGSHCIN